MVDAGSPVQFIRSTKSSVMVLRVDLNNFLMMLVYGSLRHDTFMLVPQDPPRVVNPNGSVIKLSSTNHSCTCLFLKVGLVTIARTVLQ